MRKGVKNNMIGILYFHHNWTDVMNSMSLIDYYSSKKYKKIIILVKKNSEKLLEYYIYNKENIEIIYFELDDNSCIILPELLKKNNILMNDLNYDILFHGNADSDRNDKYKGKFSNIPNDKIINGGFVNNGFYECYDIPSKVRIEYFNFYRDKDAEEKIYQDFIKKYGKNYILHHEIDGSLENNEISYVNLNKISDTFLDHIKVLENSIEFHLLDSCWGALIYILDSKYGLFKDKNVFLYSKRGYTKMFSEPILLPNWKIKN